MTTAKSKIGFLQNAMTGENAPPHFIGTDTEGRRLVQFVADWQPLAKDMRVIFPEQDLDGNWIEGTECEPHAFE